jgi:hypothetical protein
MFIVPFIHNVINHNNIKIHNIKLLTIGGKYLWEEDNNLDIDTDILNPNDIYRKNDIIKFKQLMLCNTDTNKTNISEFYKWDEINVDDKEIFCWRKYIYLSGNDDSVWFDIPTTEKLGKYLVKDIINIIINNK